MHVFFQEFIWFNLDLEMDAVNERNDFSEIEDLNLDNHSQSQSFLIDLLKLVLVNIFKYMTTNVVFI